MISGFSNMSAALLNSPDFSNRAKSKQSAVADTIVWLHMLAYYQVVMKESGFQLAIPEL